MALPLRSLVRSVALRLSAAGPELAAVVLVALGTGLLVVGSSWSLLATGLGLGAAAVGAVRTRANPLARALSGRVAVVVGASLAQLAADGSTTAPVVLGTAVLVGLLAAERPLNRLGSFRPPVVANLPGVRPTPMRPSAAPAVVAGVLLSAAVGLVVAWTGGSRWWFLGSSVLAVVPAVLLVAAGRARVNAARRRQETLPAALAAYGPRFLVYTSRPDDASYQIAMWLPYLERTGLPFVIVTRNRIPAEALAELTDVPVLEARGLRDLEGLLVPSLRAAFYVNASSGNGACVRYQHLTHIYLGHGDSDKPPSYNPTHAMYDKIFVAGPAAVRRYAAHGVTIAADRFQVVGRPQVEAVGQVAEADPATGEPTLLYAPTWRGHVKETRLSSQLAGEQIVAALLARGARVVFRPHPFSYTFPEERAAIERTQALLAADARQTGRTHLWGPAAETERSSSDCINLSHAMVGDISSVVSDYLFSGKPFALVAVPAEPQVFLAEYPVARASYVVHADLSDLDAALEQMLGADPLAARRRQVRDDYLGAIPAATYAATFVDAVRQHALTSDSSVASTGGLGEVDREENEGAEASSRRSWLPLWRLVRTDVLPAVVALAGLLATVLPVPGRPAAGAVGAGVGLLAVAALGWVHGPSFRDRSQWSRTLGRSVVARTLVALSLVALVWSSVPTGRSDSPGPGAAVATALAAAALLGTLVAERVLNRAANRAQTVVASFPAAAPRPAQLLSVAAVPAVSLTCAAATFLAALLGAPTWALTLGAVLPLLVTAAAVVRERAQQEDLTDEDRLHAAMLELRPEFAVYFASTAGAAYQVGMWLPYLARIGRPFVIITRSTAMLLEIARTTRQLGLTVPLVYRPTLGSLDDIVVPSLRAAFYVNNAVRNTHLIERRELTHVWLNHGDSEKPACFNPVHAIYDVIFAAGQAGVDRYARHGVDIPSSKFEIVGRPQVERIIPARRRVAEVAEPTVLYAPTWRGPYADSRVYSLPVGSTIVRALLERGVRVVFRAHPFNHRDADARLAMAEVGRLLSADRAATGRRHVWGPDAEQAMTIEDCFNVSDAMIADVSAVVSDYLRSDKPFGIVSVGRSPEHLLADAPAARAAYLIRDDVANLDDVLDDLLHRDPLAGVRSQTRRYHLGDIPDESYAEAFLAAARRVIDRPPPAGPGADPGLHQASVTEDA